MPQTNRFWLQVGSFRDRIRDQIDGADGADVKVVASNGDVIDPGMVRKADEESALAEMAMTIRLVNEKPFASADE